MLRLFTFAIMAAFLSLSWAARPVTSTKKGTAKKATSKTARKTTAKKGSGRPATTWRNRQMSPTAARYRQIQDALAAKGYLRPEEATGVWNGASVDALKKFQMEQNIESSGKINSLSLIALGLGPKHDTALPKPAPPVQ
jgi:peptidoglycan hydrolase-like protein with peptidoglycan-binding domain